ncbi:MAG: gamma-glutamylcyclotransferase [Octadecabacter sp.]|nr:gamma-glutamylcyclotransferase [Octadecabacter sp.]
MTMWVFGYGSLLWNPGFKPAETVTATLSGYHRSFCMLSIHHRGSVEKPGLVLALDAGDAICTGVAFRVAEPDELHVLDELRERELVSSAYEEAHLPLALRDGREVLALAYVIKRNHEQYCQFDLERQAQMIARSVGGRGPNPEYLFNTVEHLLKMGIHDPDMEWLTNRVRTLT